MAGLSPEVRARLVHRWRGGRPGGWRAALQPLALAYRSGLIGRELLYRWGVRKAGSLPCRVLSVGNLTVGGTGKTPLLETLARTLAAEGCRVAIASRGYGGRRRQDVAIVSDGDVVRLSADAAGDEPVVLARRLRGVPVVVGRDRLRAGALAVEVFAPDVLLLDDAFQQRRLRKDLDVVCLDARAPFGPGGLLPAGSLREPAGALGRADLLLVTHADGTAAVTDTAVLVRPWAPGVPLIAGVHEAESVEVVDSGLVEPPEALRGRAVLAFAGIAVPEDLASLAAAAGATVRELVPLPDHHRYATAELTALLARGRARGVDVLLTTEKDLVRLPALPPSPTPPIWALRVRLRLLDHDGAWWRTLRARLR